jgi:hypothetical protein
MYNKTTQKMINPSMQDGSIAFDAAGDQLTALGDALELLQAAIKATEAPRILLCTGHLAARGVKKPWENTRKM